MPNVNPAVIEAFLVRLDDLGATYAVTEGEIASLQERIVEMQAQITEHQASLTDLRIQADQLRQAAYQLGFDLFAENDRRITWAPEDGSNNLNLPQPVDQFSVRQYVLSTAKASYPHPVRAAQLREQLRSMGHDIHDKTIGMTLYRLSKKGFIERRGLADWFYVPADQRKTASPIEEEAA